MCQITVEITAMEDVAGVLDVTGERLDGAARSLPRATGAPAGHAGLASALDQFADCWEHGLRAVATAVDTAGDQLAEAMRVYRTLEDQISDAAAR